MKKSPINFVGAAMGTAGAALGTQHLLGRLGGLFGGSRGNTNFTGVGGLGEQYAGVGARPAGVVDASAQFNPEAIHAANGIFGNVNARQAAVGASGIFRKTSKYDNV